MPAELWALVLSRKLIDAGFMARDWDTIRPLLMALVLLFVLRSVLGYAAAAWSMRLQLQVNQRFQRELFSHLLRLPMADLSRQTAGRLMSRVLDDGTRFAAVFQQVFGRAAIEPVKAAVFLLLLAYFDVRLCALMLVIAVASLVVIRWMGLQLNLLSKQIQEKDADLYAYVEQTLFNVELVKSKAAEELSARQFDRRLDELITLSLRIQRVMLAVNPILQLLKYAALGSVLVGGGWMIGRSAMTVGTLTTFMGATYLLFNSLQSIAGTYGNLRENLARLEVLYALRDRPAEPADPTTQAMPPPVLETIEFRNVSFGYRRSAPVLQNVSFEIRKGEIFAITGQSGSGKTTLIRLLVRLYDPDQGMILLNGRSHRDFDLRSLRKLVGIVFQENLIVNDTVGSNIAFGNPHLSANRIQRAARICGAEEFIHRLPRRYDTVVGESGRQLSGGQRQRLAIARAVVSDPAVLVLDEGTSFLEVEQEARVLQMLKTHRKDKITIFVSHRPTVMDVADRVMVIDNGRVVDRGPAPAVRSAGGLNR